MDRLSRRTLGGAASAVALPPAAALDAGVGIVHLGLGAFHRGHQAILTQRALAHASGPWAISGVSLRGAAVRDALQPQDCLYGLIENDGVAEVASVVGVVREALFAPEEGELVLARLASPATRIVTLTVTEKGYCHHPATRRSRLRPSGHPGRPCGAEPATLDPRLARERAGPAAGGGERRAHRALLRQHGEQRPHAAPSRRSVRQRVRARARDLDRGPGPLPEQHGRPHRPGRHAGLARPCGSASGPARRGGGQHRRLRAVGDRGRLRRRPAMLGGGRRAAGRAMSAPTRT